MAKGKNKGNNRQNNQQQNRQQSAAQKPTVKTVAPVAKEEVVNSSSETEFNLKKDKLFEQFINDISDLENEKAKAEQASNAAKEALEKIENERKEVQAKKEAIQAELKEAQSALAAAQKAKDQAEQEAKLILDDTEKEKLEIIVKAESDARGAWKKQADALAEQYKELGEREQTLQRAKLQLENDKRDFEMQREELSELQAFIARQKEKYAGASPKKVDELTLELDEMREKYENLRGKLGEQTNKYVELQTLLDSIKAEIQDSADGDKSITVKSLVLTLQDIKEKYNSLVLLHEKYPDDASIRPLEKAAAQVDALSSKCESLERERNRFQEEAKAAQRTQKELEIIKQEVDATNALNEHLLKELQSHKTALESRTGDTCPDLTKVDTEIEGTELIGDIAKRKGRRQLTSLPEIVMHVKNYAGSRKKEEQLRYFEDDIRAFLAGMAVSRLIILQGMSGTGKSSLPRIFSEAISGFNRLIPVESSWRDRNELLGYYNDFNKKFNAKSFTIELYRSGKKTFAEIPTFIVLDEMNLARIEYYFSDFLAILQEPDHDKWLIELVSSDMRALPMELSEEDKDKMRKESASIYTIWEKIEMSRKGELSSETTDDERIQLSKYLEKLGKLTGAKDLIDGRKVRVTDNIWFIGTANRDESTFEISDKVYDRAQVVSLDKKDKEVKKYDDRAQMYISAPNLIQLFENAKNNNDLNADVEARLEKLDELLIDKFDVSFGYRIVKQTIDFAAVFCAAGGKLDNALDYQISTKILRKVILSDDIEALIDLQAHLSNYTKTNELIGKRIKDLKR